MNRDRVERELSRLRDGGQFAEIVVAERPYVLYRRVPTGGGRFGLPVETDVIVPIPDGYPASMIDLAGLPSDSPLLAKLKGGTNSQGVAQLDGRTWQLASYHPHNGGGGLPWDQIRHGFHTYFGDVLAWLDRIG